MNTSIRKRTFDTFLTFLNQNSYGVKFSGNYVFKFWPQGEKNDYPDFAIQTKNEGDLEITETEVVPMVDAELIQQRYNNLNDRNDVTRDFMFAVKINDKKVKLKDIEFKDDNPAFLALIETAHGVNGQMTFTTETHKISYKVREPDKGAIFKHNATYYQIFFVSMTLTEVKEGEFGDEHKFYFGEWEDVNFAQTDDYRLDNYTFSTIVSKLSDDGAPISTGVSGVTPHNIDWSGKMTINYRPDKIPDILLENESDATVDKIDKEYRFVWVKPSKTIIRKVQVTDANGDYENNDLIRINFRIASDFYGN